MGFNFCFHLISIDLIFFNLLDFKLNIMVFVRSQRLVHELSATGGSAGADTN
jgi:hypothetical protein